MFRTEIAVVVTFKPFTSSTLMSEIEVMAIKLGATEMAGVAEEAAA